MASPIDKAKWDAVFGTSAVKPQCGPQRPAINAACNDGNAARWGFCSNLPSQACQEDPNDDSDAAIGIGLKGQAGCPMGAAGRGCCTFSCACCGDGVAGVAARGADERGGA